MHAVTQVGATSYAYDDNGNMTDRGDQDLTWNVENMVTSVDDNGDITTFVYDGDGNRVKKTIHDGDLDEETILYINLYYEKNLTTGVVTTSYYLGGKLIAQREDTTLTYIHQDSLSSTSLMTDNTGAQTGTTMKYMPFGATRSGSVDTDKQFTGQRLDSTTDLYYYNARYYDPVIGRFISPDTIVQDFSNPQTLNRYSYCVNNPLKYVDPTGLDYIIVGGSGSTWEDQWWIDILIALDWDPRFDRVLFIADSPSGLANGWEIGDQYTQLEDAIQNGGYKDIKLIGHSEGACTIAKFLDKIADNDNYLSDTDVRDQLSAAVLMESITGFADWGVRNWDDAALVNLPNRLKRAGIDMKFADISSYGSWIHNKERPGWENNSFEVKTNGKYITGKHGAVTTNQDTYKIMRYTFGIDRALNVDNLRK